MQMRFTYSEALAHQIFAAADLLLVPSLFEPCGLTQVGSGGGGVWGGSVGRPLWGGKGLSTAPEAMLLCAQRLGANLLVGAVPRLCFRGLAALPPHPPTQARHTHAHTHAHTPTHTHTIPGVLPCR